MSGYEGSIQNKYIYLNIRARRLEEYLADGRVNLRNFTPGVAGTKMGGRLLDAIRAAKSAGVPLWAPEGEWECNLEIGDRNYYLGPEANGEAFNLHGEGINKTIFKAFPPGGSGNPGNFLRLDYTASADLRDFTLDASLMSSGSGLSAEGAKNSTIVRVHSKKAFNSGFLFNGEILNLRGFDLVAEETRGGHAFTFSASLIDGVTKRTTDFYLSGPRALNCYGSGVNIAGARRGLVTGLIATWDFDADYPSNYAVVRIGNDSRDIGVFNTVGRRHYRGIRLADTKNCTVWGGQLIDMYGPAITLNSKDQLAWNNMVGGFEISNPCRGFARPDPATPDEGVGTGYENDTGIRAVAGNAWTVSNISLEADKLHDGQGTIVQGQLIGSPNTTDALLCTSAQQESGQNYSVFDRMISAPYPGGGIFLNALPTDGETVTINGGIARTYTFKSNLSGAPVDSVLIVLSIPPVAADLRNTAINLRNAINHISSGNNVTSPNDYVSAYIEDSLATIVNLEGKTQGSGRTISLTVSNPGTNLSLNNEKMSIPEFSNEKQASLLYTFDESIIGQARSIGPKIYFSVTGSVSTMLKMVLTTTSGWIPDGISNQAKQVLRLEGPALGSVTTAAPGSAWKFRDTDPAFYTLGGVTQKIKRDGSNLLQGATNSSLAAAFQLNPELNVGAVLYDGADVLIGTITNRNQSSLVVSPTPPQVDATFINFRYLDTTSGFTRSAPIRRTSITTSVSAILVSGRRL